MAELTIYRRDETTEDQVIAPDNEDGRMIASQVLHGTRADAETAQPTGFAVTHDELSQGQRQHLDQHGWCGCEADQLVG